MEQSTAPPPAWTLTDGNAGNLRQAHALAAALGRPARDWVVPNSFAVLVFAERDRSFRDRLSDHCPVSVRLRLP